jgi:hypothetical protein
VGCVVSSFSVGSCADVEDVGAVRLTCEEFLEAVTGGCIIFDGKRDLLSIACNACGGRGGSGRSNGGG